MQMKIIFALTATALTTAALSFPAAASTVGCKPENPQIDSVKATGCGVQQGQLIRSSRARSSLAYAPRAHHKKIVRSSRSMRHQPPTPALSDTEGVKGGSSN
jgi:hypothetical protein